MVKNSSRGWLRVRGEAVCASLRGMLFEPCFHFEKTDDRSFRGSLSGLGFAYCDFTRRDITLPIVHSATCGAPPSEPRCPRRSGASVSTTEKPRATKTRHVDNSRQRRPVPRARSLLLSVMFRSVRALPHIEIERESDPASFSLFTVNSSKQCCSGERWLMSGRCLIDFRIGPKTDLGVSSRHVA